MEQILEIGQGWEFDPRDYVHNAPLTEIQVEQSKSKGTTFFWLLVLVVADLYWKKKEEAATLSLLN